MASKKYLLLVAHLCILKEYLDQISFNETNNITSDELSEIDLFLTDDVKQMREKTITNLKKSHIYENILSIKETMKKKNFSSISEYIHDISIMEEEDFLKVINGSKNQLTKNKNRGAEIIQQAENIFKQNG